MRKNICNCNDPDCKKEIKTTKEGKMYITNMFSCGIIKEQIIKLNKLKI